MTTYKKVIDLYICLFFFFIYIIYIFFYEYLIKNLIINCFKKCNKCIPILLNDNSHTELVKYLFKVKYGMPYMSYV